MDKRTRATLVLNELSMKAMLDDLLYTVVYSTDPETANAAWKAIYNYVTSISEESQEELGAVITYAAEEVKYLSWFGEN